MKKQSFIIIVLIMVLTNTFLFAQEKVKTFIDFKQEITKFIEKEMKSTGTIGLSIALVDNQELVWSEGFGYADLKNKIKATPQTIYRVGSISKLFTATSVMQLAESGKIDIDDPIQNYIPEFKIKSRFEKPGAITPRNVLTHHSGLPSDVFYQFFSNKPDPFQTVVKLLNEEYTCTQPNTIFSYSNAGYSLLGVLVEKASGEDFYDYTQEHLFGPLQMKNSSFRLTKEMEGLYAKGYAKKKVVDEPLIRDVPAGMLHSNVIDMANFIKMTFNNGSFDGKQILKSETLKEMQSKQNINCPLDMNFNIGLCWWINPVRWNYAGNYAEHGGDTYVYHGELATLTTQKIGVVVLLNTAEGASLTGKIASEILTKYLEFKKGIKKPEIIAEDKKADNISSQGLKKISGLYILGLDVFDIKAKTKKLTTKQNIATLVLKPTTNGMFKVKARIFGIIPVKVKGQEMKFRNINGTDYILFKGDKTDTIVIGTRTTRTNITEIWKNRLGKYDITNDTSEFAFIKDIELTEMNGFIILKGTDFTKDKISFVLKPINDNEAIVDGIGRNTGSTIFFKGDEIYMSGFKLKKKPETSNKK